MWVNYPKMSKKILNIVCLFFTPNKLIVNIYFPGTQPGGLLVLTGKY